MDLLYALPGGRYSPGLIHGMNISSSHAILIHAIDRITAQLRRRNQTGGTSHTYNNASHAMHCHTLSSTITQSNENLGTTLSLTFLNCSTNNSFSADCKLCTGHSLERYIEPKICDRYHQKKNNNLPQPSPEHTMIAQTSGILIVMGVTLAIFTACGSRLWRILTSDCERRDAERDAVELESAEVDRWGVEERLR